MERDSVSKAKLEQVHFDNLRPRTGAKVGEAHVRRGLRRSAAVRLKADRYSARNASTGCTLVAWRAGK
jgi:hypothetical protein